MQTAELNRAIAENVRVEIARQPLVRQTHIAEAIGMTQQSLNGRINGRIPFEAATLAKVADYLNCDVSVFLSPTAESA